MVEIVFLCLFLEIVNREERMQPVSKETVIYRRSFVAEMSILKLNVGSTFFVSPRVSGISKYSTKHLGDCFRFLCIQLVYRQHSRCGRRPGACFERASLGRRVSAADQRRIRKSPGYSCQDPGIPLDVVFFVLGLKLRFHRAFHKDFVNPD